MSECRKPSKFNPLRKHCFATIALSVARFLVSLYPSSDAKIDVVSTMQPQQRYQQAIQTFRAGQHAESAQHCQQLLQLQPKHPDVLHLLGLNLQALQQPQDAARIFKFVLRQQANHKGAQKSLIGLYNRLGLQEDALPLATLLVKQHSNDPEAVFLQAQTLRDLGHFDQALQLIEPLRDQLPQAWPLLDYLYAGVLHDLDRYNDAEQVLLALVAAQPEYIDAHTTLNKLYWEQGPQEKFMDSIRTALAQLPQSRALHYCYAVHFLIAERYDECRAAVEHALTLFPNAAEFVHLLGSTFAREDANDTAMQHYLRALDLQPNSDRYQLDVANLLIKAGDYERALTHLDKAEQLAPDNQEMWAYKGLCYRLLNDPRSQWLDDYDGFVQALPIDVPPEYASREAFIDAVVTALDGLHKSAQQPLDQSVRNGTQTVGYLFQQQHPAIKQYKQMLERATQRYLKSLPNDAKHPFLRRKQQQFRFTGAWSVKLKESGFHTNHVHPKGWLSCCSYLKVPSNVRQDDPQRQGWIKFGETSMQLGEREQIAKAVCPQAGYVVFFPSYFWHGTVPFAGDEVRMTLPVDIAPHLI